MMYFDDDEIFIEILESKRNEYYKEFFFLKFVLGINII